jgi:hypothetical protein
MRGGVGRWFGVCRAGGQVEIFDGEGHLTKVWRDSERLGK